MRCPSCGGSGDASFYGYRTACAECDGTGLCSDARQWLHACRGLIWFALTGVLLSCVGAVVIAMLLGLTLDAALSILGQHARTVHRTLWRVTPVIATALMGVLWVSEGGPRRPGRGLFGSGRR